MTATFGQEVEDEIRLRSFDEPVSALVVGASGGIGFQLVRQLLAMPTVSKVYATVRSRDARPNLLDLAANEGGRLVILRADLCDESSLEAAAQQVSSEGDHLNLVINCVGVLHSGEMKPERSLRDVRVEAVEHGFRVNATGLLLLAKHVSPLLPRRGRVVFASLSARVGSIGDNRAGGWYTYRASKAAQNMIMRTLAIELRRRCSGLICVALHPGTVDTDLSKPFQRSVRPDKLFSPRRAARQLLEVIDTRTSQCNGRFWAWDGTEIPW